MILNIVDLFCGAGGMTAGILAAAKRLRLKVHFTAVNHWDTAINSHSLNHPNVHHICEPVENLIPAKVIPSRRLHLLSAGCECTFHSNARGGGPCNEQSRSQAWQIIRWATDIRVDNIQMENVREFQDWGPLHPCTCRSKKPGKHRKGFNCFRPIEKRRGEYFTSFINALKALGYTVEYNVPVAADYGDPTSRKRFILMARLNNAAITWPKPTHCDPELLNGRRNLRPWRTAREIIDWSLKGTSIFDRKKPLCENTMARIAAGLKKFGGANAEPFLMILRGSSGSHLNNSQSLDEPLPTVSTSGKHHYLVEPRLKGKGMNGKGIHSPHSPAEHSSAFIIGQQSCAAPRNVDQPLPTIAQAGAIRLVRPMIVTMDRPHTNRSKARSVDEPVATVTGTPRMALVESFIYSANHGNDPKKRGTVQRRLNSLDKPLRTVTRHPGLGFCQPILTQIDQTGGNGAYSRPLTKPLGTIVSKQNTLLVQPMLAKFYGTGGCAPLTAPLDTVTTRDRFMLVEFPLKKSRSKKASTGTVIGELDILTRMLQPHELMKAHSLDDFILTGTKEDQTAQIGNSVPKKLAEAHAYQLLKPYAK